MRKWQLCFVQTPPIDSETRTRIKLTHYNLDHSDSRGRRAHRHTDRHSHLLAWLTYSLDTRMTAKIDTKTSMKLCAKSCPQQCNSLLYFCVFLLFLSSWRCAECCRCAHVCPVNSRAACTPFWQTPASCLSFQCIKSSRATRSRRCVDCEWRVNGDHRKTPTKYTSKSHIVGEQAEELVSESMEQSP